MIHLEFDNIEDLKSMHYNAVEDYVKNKMTEGEQDSLYANIIRLPNIGEFPTDRNNEDYNWLKRFILADVEKLNIWVDDCPQMLKFDCFKKLYTTRFSNGKTKYVDSANTYNSYTLLKEMNIRVCPYCEDQFIEEVNLPDGKRRTMEFDHFYPKGNDEYPALAMCFYNLVPSCITCNRIKLARQVGANPYSENIESETNLSVDLPIGVNMDQVSQEDCEIKFNAKGKMILNVSNLGLEDRYKHLKPLAYSLLSKKQKYPIEKLKELEKLGFGDVQSLKVDFFGQPRNIAKGKELHTKLKWDLIGY